MTSRAAPAFIGRSRELATLEALLADARAGKPCVALVFGEPGIGKTRTVQELARAAHTAGVHVLWSTCFEEDSMPFAPWAHVADEIVALTDPGELADRLGAAAATAATVVPRLRDALPRVSPPAALAPTESRFRVYESLARLVAGTVHREPTLVVLEDLQWADAASLELLAYVARTLAEEPLLLVGTAREVALDHPLGHALADAERMLNVHRLRLTALGDDAIALLIEDLVGYRPSSHVVQAIAGETAGNPFFAVALIRHLAEEGHDLAAEVVPAAIPGSVRDAVGRRLDTQNALACGCSWEQRRSSSSAPVSPGRPFPVYVGNGLEDSPYHRVTTTAALSGYVFTRISERCLAPVRAVDGGRRRSRRDHRGAGSRRAGSQRHRRARGVDSTAMGERIHAPPSGVR